MGRRTKDAGAWRGLARHFGASRRPFGQRCVWGDARAPLDTTHFELFRPKNEESAITKSEKCEKSEKSIFPISQLERTVVQFVPVKREGWAFSDFPKNFRGCMGGIKAGYADSTLYGCQALAANGGWLPAAAAG